MCTTFVVVDFGGFLRIGVWVEVCKWHNLYTIDTWGRKERRMGDQKKERKVHPISKDKVREVNEVMRPCPKLQEPRKAFTIGHATEGG